MDLATALSTPRRWLLEAVRAGVNREPTWHSPEEWMDSDGLIAGCGQVWLYRALPARVLSEPQLLADALEAVGAVAPGRQLHLLVHTWDQMFEPAPQTPAPLAAFQRSALQALVPTRAVTVGVELLASQSPVTPVLGDLREGVDEMLGETAPAFSAYDSDRRAVDDALRACGAQPLDRERTAFLLSWFTLGVVSDARAVEADDMITLADSSVVELATTESLDRDGTPQALPDAEAGSSVLSVRGTVQPHGGEGADLMRVSVIYGRRAHNPLSPWPVALRAMPTIKAQPLPLRQLDALAETLPCSPNRLSPSHQRLAATQLAALGFAEPDLPRAGVGLLVGLGGHRMTSPLIVNPLHGHGLTAIVGAAGSGRTFLASALAAQAALGGFAVTYISAGSNQGRAYGALAGAPVWAPGNAGDLDPARWLPTGDVMGAYSQLVDALDIELTDAERAGLNRGFSRAELAGAGNLLDVLTLADNRAAAAKMLRVLRGNPAASLFLSEGPGSLGTLPDGLLVDLGSLARSPLAALGATTLARHVARGAAHPHLVVLDGFEPTDARWWRDTLTSAAQNPAVALVVTASAGRGLPAELNQAAHRFALAGSEPGLLELVGLPDSPARRTWLAEAFPILEDSQVVAPAAGVYRAPQGQTTSVEIGPFAADSLQVLTLGRAHLYDPS